MKDIIISFMCILLIYFMRGGYYLCISLLFLNKIILRRRLDLNLCGWYTYYSIGGWF